MANFTGVFDADISAKPSIGFKKTTKVRVDVAQFGDGYAQRVASGLNTHNDEFQVVYTHQDLKTANKIQYFLEQAGSGTDLTSLNILTPTSIGETTDALPVPYAGLVDDAYYIGSNTAKTLYYWTGSQWKAIERDISRAGVQYFLWTPPDSTIQYKIVCSEWEIEYSSSISRTISAKFIRVYDL